MDSLHLTLLPFLLAGAVAFFSSPVVIWFYKRMGWVIDPKKAKHPAHRHKGKIPKGGGIPVYLGLWTASLVMLMFDEKLWAIFAASSLVVVVGILDDIMDLNPYLRLGTNLVAALIVIGAGIGIPYITNPLTGGVINLDQPRLTLELFGESRTLWIMADLFALLWIPFVMNAVNWSKGLDGQLPGVVVVAGIVIGLLSFSYSADMTQWPVAVLAFSLAGAYAGYLPFNFYPQKSMPGYAGGSLAGFMLAVLAILSTTKVGTALVVLGVPFVDAVAVGTRRIMAGRSPFWGDDKHLHHHLLRMGWGKRRIAIFYWVVTAALGAVALQLSSRQKLFTIVLIAIILVGFSLWIYFGRYFGRQGRGNG